MSVPVATSTVEYDEVLWTLRVVKGDNLPREHQPLFACFFSSSAENERIEVKLDAEGSSNQTIIMRDKKNAALHVEVYWKSGIFGKEEHRIAVAKRAIEDFIASGGDYDMTLEVANSSGSRDDIALKPAKSPVLKLSVTKGFDHKALSETLRVNGTIESSVVWMTKVLQVAETVASVVPLPGPVSAEVGSSLLLFLAKEIQGYISSKKALAELIERAAGIVDIVVKIAEDADGKHDEQAKVIRDLAKKLDDIVLYTVRLAKEPTVKRYIKFSGDDVDEFRRALDRLLERFKVAARVDTQYALARVEKTQKVQGAVKQLHVAEGSHATNLCLKGTRRVVLQRIFDWANAHDDHHVFLLRGPAGVGKSTIAHTVAFELASVFVTPFFKFIRGDVKRRAEHLWPTFAKQLAEYDETYAAYLADLKPDLLGSDVVRVQYEHLIQRARFSRPVVFVIDALDECPDGDERQQLITSLLELNPDFAGQAVRFFITARDDGRLHALASEESSLALRADPEDAEGDIIAVVSDRLRLESGFLANGLAGLRVDIAGEGDAGTLALEHTSNLVVRASQGIFECARVLCSALAGGTAQRTPVLQRLVETEGAGQSLYDVYLDILDRVLAPAKPHPDDTSTLKRFKRFMAWLLVLRSPQKLESLKGLISATFPDDTPLFVELLAELAPVLRGTLRGDIDAIAPYHTSFRDFLLDRGKNSKHHVCDEHFAAHGEVAHATLHLMNTPPNGLCFNICKFPSSFLSNDEAGNGVQLGNMSPSLKYACSAAGWHLNNAQTVISDKNLTPQTLRTLEEQIPDLSFELDFFLNEKFLFWLEALSCLSLDVATHELFHMRAWAKANPFNDISDRLDDYIRFDSNFRDCYISSAPHVYISALPFAPQTSLVRQTFWPRFRRLASVTVERLGEGWDTVETISSPLLPRQSWFPPCFSPDGSRCIVACEDASTFKAKGLQLWDTGSWAPIGKPLACESGISCVAFSPNGSMIAVCCWDGDIQLWDIETRSTTWIWRPDWLPDNRLHGADHSAIDAHDHLAAITFSPNSQRLLVAGSAGTVDLFDITQRRSLVRTVFDGYGHIHNVAYLPDGERVAIMAVRRVWFWNSLTSLVKPFIFRHHSSVCLVSPDGSRAVSADLPSTIYKAMWLRDLSADEELGNLPIASDGGTLQFSPNSAILAYMSSSHRLSFYDATTRRQIGDTVALPRYPRGVCRSLTFIPNGTHILLPPTDSCLFICAVPSSSIREQNTPSALRYYAGAVAFLRDRERLVSVSGTAIRVWDASTGTAIDTVDTVSDWSNVISPDGTHVAKRTADEVALYDVDSGTKRSFSLPAAATTVTKLAFCGNELAIARNTTVSILDATLHADASRSYKGLEEYGDIYDFAFSPDGRKLVTFAAEGHVTLRDLRSHSQILVMNATRMNATRKPDGAVAFSPDSSKFAYGDAGSIYVWDASDAHCIANIRLREEDKIGNFAFSPTSPVIAFTSGTDFDFPSLLHFWDLGTGSEICDPYQLQYFGDGASLAFSPDGTRIATSCELDACIRIWTAPDIPLSLLRDGLSKSSLTDHRDTMSSSVDTYPTISGPSAAISGTPMMFRGGRTLDSESSWLFHPSTSTSPQAGRALWIPRRHWEHVLVRDPRCKLVLSHKPGVRLPYSADEFACGEHWTDIWPESDNA